jgi:hypothetical protein
LELEVSVKFLPKPPELSRRLSQEREGACQFRILSTDGRRGSMSSPAYSLPANSTCSYEFQAQSRGSISNYCSAYSNRMRILS